MKQIVFKTNGKGGLKVEAQGFQGPSCENTLKGFLNRMGVDQGVPEPTPEYYQTEGEQQWEGECS